MRWEQPQCSWKYTVSITQIGIRILLFFLVILRLHLHVIASDDRITDELEGIWKQAIVVWSRS
jgi:hypothetical protein